MKDVTSSLGSQLVELNVCSDGLYRYYMPLSERFVCDLAKMLVEHSDYCLYTISCSEKNYNLPVVSRRGGNS